jgi:VWFA-related protein
MTMRKPIFLIGILFLILLTFGQELQHEARAILIEVDVRVFKGNRFINDLDIHDFEVYEEGKLQEIEAVYLIKEKNIERQLVDTSLKGEEIQPVKPITSIQKRTFILMFELVEYLPRVGELIDYFFNEVLLPGDSLIVTTPRKNYRFNEEAFEKMPKEKIAEELKGKVRKDAVLGSSAYRNMLKEFRNIEHTAFSDRDIQIQMLMEIFRKLKGYMYIDRQKISQFGEFLRQIHVFFFYQKNLVPIPTDLSDYYEFELFPDLSLNSDEIREAFSDASVTCHFLYITEAPLTDEGKEQTEYSSAQGWVDTRADIFSGFSEMADATGGMTISSRSPEFSFKQAMEASENYYLIYYKPKDYKTDGKFRKIKVKIKGKNYRILHRAGYIAD